MNMKHGHGHAHGHGYAALTWKFSMNIQNGHAAWTCMWRGRVGSNRDMQKRHAAYACTMLMLHGDMAY
jgi:hypothetical protein